jgi:hypothetical protein
MGDQTHWRFYKEICHFSFNPPTEFIAGDETCLSIVFCVSRRGPRNRRSLAWLGMTKERATVLKEWLLNRDIFQI